MLKMTDAARDVLRADETDSAFWLALGSRGEYLVAIAPCRCRPPWASHSGESSTKTTPCAVSVFAWLTPADLNPPNTQPALLIVAETVESARSWPTTSSWA